MVFIWCDKLLWACPFDFLWEHFNLVSKVIVFRYVLYYLGTRTCSSLLDTDNQSNGTVLSFKFMFSLKNGISNFL